LITEDRCMSALSVKLIIVSSSLYPRFIRSFTPHIKANL
jgi:hypothetical protein